MKKETISIQKAKEEVSISKYLASHGHYPVGETGGQLKYRSPFRDEKEPSMFVNENKGLWNDFGHGGGSIIDLVMQINNDVRTVQDALLHLTNLIGTLNFSTSPAPVSRKIENNSLSNIQVLHLNHFVLLKYLREERGISSNIAQKYLKLVIYNNQYRKGLFGIGWKNDTGYYEIRNAGKKSFKTVTGTKDITTIAPLKISSSLYVFEGMLDYLSVLMMKGSMGLNGKVVILNSTAMVKKVIPIIQGESFETVYTFFDNDKGGEAAFSKLQNGMINSVLKPQIFYKDYNDVNEYWINKLNSRK